MPLLAPAEDTLTDTAPPLSVHLHKVATQPGSDFSWDDIAPAAPAAPAASAAPAGAQPDMTKARQAPDGKTYVPDPARPGKYLQVAQPAPVAPAARAQALSGGGSDFSWDDVAPPGDAENLDSLRKMLTRSTKPEADPNIDYTTGAPWNLQLALARADNPKEAAAELEHRVGPGNYGQDDKGNWWVAQNGKKLAVRPQVFDAPVSRGHGARSPEGGFWKNTKNAATNLATDVVAQAGPIAGAAAGALGGGALGGPPGAMLGAAGGYAVGKGGDEAVKAFGEDALRKTPSEEIDTIGEGAVENAALEGFGGPAVRAIGSGAQQLMRWLAGTTPETRGMTKIAIEKGMKAPLVSTAPELKGPQYKEKMGVMLSGDTYAVKNARALVQQARDIFESSGALAPHEIDEVMREIEGVDFALSPDEANHELTRATQQRHGQVRAEFETALGHVRQYATQAQAQVQQFANGQSGRLGEDVKEAIVRERRAFSAHFNQLYDQITEMAGDEKIVPAAPFRRAARDMLDSLSPNAVADTAPAEYTALKELAGANDDAPMLTFAEAHRLRSTLRLFARKANRNLTPDVLAHGARMTAERANEALESIADLGDAMDLAGMAERGGTPADVVDMLRQTDGAYRDGIAKFNNATLNRLVKDAEDGSFVDPNVVASRIVAPGNVEQTRMIMGLLPQNVRDQVARADAFNIIKATTDKETGTIDGVLLRGILNDPSRIAVMNEVYPPAILRTMRQLADELSAAGGKLDVRSIAQFSSRGMEDALRTALDRQQQLKIFAERYPLAALVSPRGDVVDAAADSILKGKQGTSLAMVRAFTGEDSPAWRAVQEYALKRAIRSAVYELPTLDKAIQGAAINSYLGQFTEAEQDMLFPAGVREDLRLLAKVSNFMFPKQMADMGAGMHAAGIKSHSPHLTALAAIAYYKAMYWVVRRPTIMRLLAELPLTDKGPGQAIAAAIGRFAEKQGMKDGAARLGAVGEQFDANAPGMGAKVILNTDGKGPGTGSPPEEEPPVDFGASP